MTCHCLYVCLQWVIPELIGQGLSTVLMLVSMHWFILLLNLPVAIWNIYRSVACLHICEVIFVSVTMVWTWQLSNCNRDAPIPMYSVCHCVFSNVFIQCVIAICVISNSTSSVCWDILWSLLTPRYVKVPMGNMGVFDPTEIHNRGQLKSHMKEAMIKLGFHLLCFFIYLYR